MRLDLSAVMPGSRLAAAASKNNGKTPKNRRSLD
jgi:hypothetical protein